MEPSPPAAPIHSLPGRQSPDRAQSLQSFHSYMPRAYLSRPNAAYYSPYSPTPASGGVATAASATIISSTPTSSSAAVHYEPNHSWSSMPGFGGRMLSATAQVDQSRPLAPSLAPALHVNTTQMAASAYQPSLSSPNTTLHHAPHPQHAVAAYSLLMENRQLRDQVKEISLQLRACETRLREAQQEHDLVMRERASVHSEMARFEAEMAALTAEKERWLARVHQLEADLRDKERRCENEPLPQPQTSYTVRVRMTKEALMNVTWKFYPVDESPNVDDVHRSYIIIVDHFLVNEELYHLQVMPLRPGDRLVSLNGITLQHSTKAFFHQLIQSTQSKCTIELLMTRVTWPGDLVLPLDAQQGRSRQRISASEGNIMEHGANVKFIPVVSWRAIKTHGALSSDEPSLLHDIANGDELLMIGMDDASSFHSADAITNAIRESQQIIVRRGNVSASHTTSGVFGPRVSLVDRSSSSLEKGSSSMPSSMPHLVEEDLQQEEHAVLGALDSILHTYANPSRRRSADPAIVVPSSSSASSVPTTGAMMFYSKHVSAGPGVPPQFPPGGVESKVNETPPRRASTTGAIDPAHQLLWRTGITPPASLDNTGHEYSLYSASKTNTLVSQVDSGPTQTFHGRSATPQDNNNQQQQQQPYFVHRRSRYPLPSHSFFAHHAQQQQQGQELHHQDTLTEESEGSNTCTPVATPCLENGGLASTLVQMESGNGDGVIDQDNDLDNFPPPLPPRINAMGQRVSREYTNSHQYEDDTSPGMYPTSGVLPLPDVATVSHSTEERLNSPGAVPVADESITTPSEPHSALYIKESSAASSRTSGLAHAAVGTSTNSRSNGTSPGGSGPGLMTAFLMKRETVKSQPEDTLVCLRSSSISNSETGDSGLEMATPSSSTNSQVENVFLGSPTESILLQSGSPKNKSGSRVSFANFIPTRIRKRIPKVGKSRIVKLPYLVLLQCLEQSIQASESRDSRPHSSSSSPPGHDSPLLLQLSNGVIFITHVRPDSVADVRGLLEGDQLLAVNSISVLNVSSLAQLREKLAEEQEGLATILAIQATSPNTHFMPFAATATSAEEQMQSAVCKLRVQFNPLKLRFSSSAESVSSSDESWRTRMVQSSSGASPSHHQHHHRQSPLGTEESISVVMVDRELLPLRQKQDEEVEVVDLEEEDEEEDKEEVEKLLSLRASARNKIEECDEDLVMMGVSKSQHSSPTTTQAQREKKISVESMLSNNSVVMTTDTVRNVFLTLEQFQHLLGELRFIGGSHCGLFISQIPDLVVRLGPEASSVCASPQSSPGPLPVRYFPDIRLGDRLLQVNKRSFHSCIGEVALRELRHMSLNMELEQVAGEGHLQHSLVCLTLQNCPKEFEKVASVAFPLTVPAHLVASKSTFLHQQDHAGDAATRNSSQSRPRASLESWDHFYVRVLFHFNEQCNSFDTGAGWLEENGATNTKKKSQRTKGNPLEGEATSQMSLRFQSHAHHLSVQLYDLVYVDATLELPNSTSGSQDAATSSGNKGGLPRYWHAWKVDRWGRKMQTGLLPSLNTVEQMKPQRLIAHPLLKCAPPPVSLGSSTSSTLGDTPVSSKRVIGGSLRFPSATATNSPVGSTTSTACFFPTHSSTRAAKCKSAVIQEEEISGASAASRGHKLALVETLDPPSGGDVEVDSLSGRFNNLHYSSSAAASVGQKLGVTNLDASLAKTPRRSVGSPVSEGVAPTSGDAHLSHVSATLPGAMAPSSSASSSPTHRSSGMWLTSGRRWMVATLSRKSSSGSSSANSSVRDKLQQVHTHQKTAIPTSNTGIISHPSAPFKTSLVGQGKLAAENAGTGTGTSMCYLPVKPVFPSKEMSAVTPSTYAVSHCGRPILLLGPLASALARYASEHLSQRFHFLPSLAVLPLSAGESTARGAFVAADTLTAIIQHVHDTAKTQPRVHCILVDCFPLLECLHKRHVYPIVVQMLFKSPKQIKELHRKLDLPGKLSKKTAKRLMQDNAIYDTQWPYYITVNLHYENLSSLLEKLSYEVDCEQKFDLLWTNCEDEMKLLSW